MPKKKGNQKPTKLVKLPYRRSQFQEAVDLYETTGRKAQAWQKGLLKHIMAYNSGSLWVDRKSTRLNSSH